MRGDSLIQQHPPTPPNAGAEYQVALHQVAEYNADRGCSFGEAGYGSPSSVAHQGIPSHASHGDDHIRGLGLVGLQYDGYGPLTEFFPNGSYGRISNDQALFSPLTPRSANGDESSRAATRTSRRMTASTSPKQTEITLRPKAIPRSRKAKTAKGDRQKIPKLTAPLSILTKELHNIPIKNMEEWVNRPADVRRREAEKRNGYIARPMNSFMLYRSAFAERAKSWCLQNNHQVVSSVAGESWPLEPPEIRDLYSEYAKLERINHQNAHPTYKFSPSKTATPARKRRNEWSDDEESSDLDDTEWAPGARSSRPRQTRRVERSISYPSSGVGVEYFDGAFGPNANGVNRSSWEMTNEGRPMPMTVPMSYNDLYNWPYHSAPYANMHMSPSYTDDLHTKPLSTSTLSNHFQSNSSMLGLPGGSADDLLPQPHPHVRTPFEEGQLDPMLLAYGGSQSSVDPTSLQTNDFRNNQVSMQEALSYHDLDNLLDLPHDEYQAWHPDPTMVSLEQESEFDKWVGEQ
ncbi:hypothetical protein J3E74DRAFT_247337 [Bipolaris maydis]|nr:hypothetical protein J3E74DRAFT_247337 [Bipolaris maydis]